MSKKRNEKQLAPDPVAPPAEGGIIGHCKRYWKFWVSVLVAIVGGGAVYHMTVIGNNTAVSNNTVGGDSMVAGDRSAVSVDHSTNNGDRITVTGNNNTVAWSGAIAVGDGSNVDIDKSVTNITNITNISTIISNITVNLNSESLEFTSVNDALRGFVIATKKPVAPVENAKVTLRDPNGLRMIADKAKAHYVEAQFKEAVEWAKAGEEIIAPIVTPYAHKSCSIESRFATNIMNVYLILAEDAWSRGDYTAAKKYANLVLSVWGPRISGDVYGFAAVIDLDERGGSDSVLCEEAVRRFEKGDKEWLYQYLNRFARWGYAHPVALDGNTKVPYLVSLEEMFGLPRKLQYSGPYVKTNFPTEDGRLLDNGELIVMIYQGMGRFTEGYIPNPDGRELPQDFTGDLRMPTAKKVNGRLCPIPAELQQKK